MRQEGSAGAVVTVGDLRAHVYPDAADGLRRAGARTDRLVLIGETAAIADLRRRLGAGV